MKAAGSSPVYCSNLKTKVMKDKRQEVRKIFLVNRDETGNLIVHMNDGTGQSYMVEFIEPKGGVRTDWGFIQPFNW